MGSLNYLRMLHNLPSPPALWKRLLPLSQRHHRTGRKDRGGPKGWEPRWPETDPRGGSVGSFLSFSLPLSLLGLEDWKQPLPLQTRRTRRQAVPVLPLAPYLSSTPDRSSPHPCFAHGPGHLFESSDALKLKKLELSTGPLRGGVSYLVWTTSPFPQSSGVLSFSVAYWEEDSERVRVWRRAHRGACRRLGGGSGWAVHLHSAPSSSVAPALVGPRQ